MVYLGYFAAIIIGIVLGLVGAGGSILTIPVLVYLIGIEPVLATTYSLFIVGSTAFVGGFRYLKKNLVSFKTLLVFGIPSIISVFFSRKYLLPAIPDYLFSIGNLHITKNIGLMLLLAGLMILASYSMIKKATTSKDEEPKNNNEQLRYLFIAQQGLMLGVLVGLLGAGGGFLMIPALVVLAKLKMKKAVGTSLAIIAINSTTGFLSDTKAHTIDWSFLLSFAGFAIIGIIIGTFLTKFISGQKLKPIFGWFILVVGIYIISKELIFK